MKSINELKSKLPLLVIVGETGAGKSTLAVELAIKLGGEIICADSWAVRREVDIGTAKPSLREREIIPHHLLDVAGPDEDFTAAVFKRLAETKIQEIARRSRLPILVGGTGLYIDSILFDYKFLPEGDRTARLELNAKSVDDLQRIIREKGFSLEDIDVQNKRRLIRLLETNGEKPTKSLLRDNTLILGLLTERQTLHERIARRVDEMIELGLENEVLTLVEKYGWECEALKGIGYSQWREYFNGTDSIKQVRDKIIKATNDLAKRQRTWFKRNKSIQWLDTPVNAEEVAAFITTALDK